MVKFIRKKATSIDENINDPVDVVNELSLLIHQQKIRVRKGIEAEAKSPHLDPQVDKAMKIQEGLLQHYVNMSFDLGLMKRVPKVVNPYDAIPTPAQSDFRNQVTHGIQISKIIREQNAPWRKEEKRFKAIISAPDFPTAGTQEERDAAFEEKYEAEILNDMMQHEAEEKGLLH